MRIEILCGGGSPQGVHVSDIYGKNGRIGVGGSELALLTLCEGWTKAGHEVILYNNPKRQDGIFEQRKVEDFDRVEKTGVVIFFREPSQKVVNVKVKKYFFSCDQYTVGDFAHFSKFVDKTIVISPFHARYFEKTYGIKDAVVIDLPVRTWDYEIEVEKVPNRMIFTSVPDRGLSYVAQTFPMIRSEIPDASLVITSDYRLWGVPDPMNNQYIQMFMRMGGVEFLGGVTRDRLIQEQLKAQVHYYPCCYDELFCIAVAESETCGTLPITSRCGALESTNMGIILDGDLNNPIVQQSFARHAIEALRNPNLSELQKKVSEKAKKRFSIDRILKEWDERVFNAD